MKPSIFPSLLATIILSSLLGGCSNESKEGDKRATLEKLKTEQANLAKEIKKLEEEIAKENPGSAAKLKAKEVDVAELKPRMFEYYVQTQGRIESENDIVVAAKAAGVITQLFVTEGQQVTKGQVLAQIDNSIIEHSMQSMEAQLELATSVFNRQEKLWNQKIGTEVQYLQAKTNKEALEKQLASLREQNDAYKIRSGISGTIDEVIVKVGTSVAPGAPAARVVNTSDLKLTAKVSESYVTDIKKGDKVIVSVPELRKDMEATVSFVGKNIDQLSRTFPIEVKLKSHPDLRPNMTASIRVVFNSIPTALVVPVNVVQTINEQKIVYVAEEAEGKVLARKKVVQLEGVYDNMAQVQGLKEGDKIITVGYQGLNDGQLIKI